VILLKNYLWPTLIYKLQTAPQPSALLGDLKVLDDILKVFICSTLRIPANSPSGFVFAAKSSGGVSAPKPSAEFSIQQVNSLVILNNSGDPFAHFFRSPERKIRAIVISVTPEVAVDEADLHSKRKLGQKMLVN